MSEVPLRTRPSSESETLYYFQHARHVCTPAEAVSEEGCRDKSCALYTDLHRFWNGSRGTNAFISGNLALPTITRGPGSSEPPPRPAPAPATPPRAAGGAPSRTPPPSAYPAPSRAPRPESGWLFPFEWCGGALRSTSPTPGGGGGRFINSQTQPLHANKGNQTTREGTPCRCRRS